MAAVRAHRRLEHSGSTSVWLRDTFDTAMWTLMEHHVTRNGSALTRANRTRRSIALAKMMRRRRPVACASRCERASSGRFLPVHGTRRRSWPNHHAEAPDESRPFASRSSRSEPLRPELDSPLLPTSSSFDGKNPVNLRDIFSMFEPVR